jgi:hypothetical protein
LEHLKTNPGWQVITEPPAEGAMVMDSATGTGPKSDLDCGTAITPLAKNKRVARNSFLLIGSRNLRLR